MATSKFKGLRAALWCRYVFSRMKVSCPSVLEHRYKKGDEAHPVTSKITNQSKLALVEEVLAMEGVTWNAYYLGEILPSNSSLLIRKLDAAFEGTANYLENGNAYFFKVLTAIQGTDATKFLIHALIDYIDDNGETSDNFLHIERRDNSRSLNDMLIQCDSDWIAVFRELSSRLPSAEVLMYGLSFENEDVFHIFLMYALVQAQFTTDDNRYTLLDKLLFNPVWSDGIRYFEEVENIPKNLWFAESFMINALKHQSMHRTFSPSEREYFSEFLR